MKSRGLEHTTYQQTVCQDYCKTSKLHVSNQRQHIDVSDSNTNPAAHFIKESSSSRSNATHKKSTAYGAVTTLKPKSNDFTYMIYKTAGVQTETEMTENQKGFGKEVEEAQQDEKEKAEDDTMEEIYGNMYKLQESSSDFGMYSHHKMSHSAPKKIPEEIAKAATPRFTCQLKLASHLTVYEQYQLCVDQLHHLRMRQSQHTESGCFTQLPEKGRKTSEETVGSGKAAVRPASHFEVNSHITNLETKKHLHNTGGESAENTEERSSCVTSKNQDESQYKSNRATLSEHTDLKCCDNMTFGEKSTGIRTKSRSLCGKKILINNAHLDPNGKIHPDLMKKAVEYLIKTDVMNTPMEPLRTKPDAVSSVEENAAHPAKPGLLQNKTRHNPSRRSHLRTVKGPQKRNEARGLWKNHGNSNMSLSGGTLQSCQGTTKYTKTLNSSKHTSPNGRGKHMDAHTILQPTETHTLHHHDDPLPRSPTEGVTVHASLNNDRCQHSPAGVPVSDCWLCLPDEVWLSILCLLPHGDLCRLMQVCRRLHTLASDRMLWKDLRIENSSLTDHWLLNVGRRRPHSLCLYSCSGLSVSTCGLERFFSLCRNSLEELKVTSCVGPGLHGDQMLSLIGQLCAYVTSVDVSWSGATDRGVETLSVCGTGLKLSSVVLNGCHVTDVPLKKVVMRHKESLCRLEVFGCQFLTPACLQAIFEMCPGLQHLNIGRVPKVNVHSLTVMASQLKCLISLNLTGLQVVNDATVDTLLQNCVKLQNLTFSSCPEVTDLTLHNICKYLPSIRSLNMSGCPAVTDAGVQSLALGCRRLQQLDLSSTGTGNRGVSLLSSYCSGQLQIVKLNFCHITSEKILKLCRHCQRLKLLHLYGCASVPTEEEIREVNSTVRVYPLP
uniref:F-box/LRR-repeat protein 7-like n=2 Tax=Acanthochromis polyacanthus TaxID=80966 RepID=A0A3Q1GUH2_9TELE